MNKRLRDVIDSLDYHELLRMKKDLNEGGFHLKKFVDHHIKEKEKQHQLHCSACMSEIDPESVNTFTLMFGSDDFKKKATFCGKDCLQYFLNNIDAMKRGANPKTL
jgi:hypothetical protein